jgi:voltage-gated potassium channel
VKPLSEAGRGFTVFYILMGFGCLAFAGHAIVESIFEKVSSGKSEKRKMKKQISRLQSHYIICGYGRVGQAAAEYFKKTNVPFAIIEANLLQNKEIRENDYLFIEGDATRESILLDAGIKSASGLLALLDSDPDNLFIVLTARELNPTLHIIARAEEGSSENKIIRAGADSVISPFYTAGRQIAGDIIAATGKSGKTSEDPTQPMAVPQWVTVQEGSGMIGETINVLAGQMGRKVIGLRRNGNDLILPDPETQLETADMILVFDINRNDEKQFSQQAHQPKKLVIVDDNPVILRLYSRLFQKAGFSPVTAVNGREGLDVIIKEKPAAAVIDFMLPFISGIEVCRQVRAQEGLQGIKLILFTGDNQPETRSRALDAGADAVVVKSSEASEVIETVIRILKEDK